MAESIIRKTIDRLVGEDGLKTDVEIALTDRTAYKVAAVIIVGGLTVSLGYHLLRVLIKNKQFTAMQQSLKAIELALAPG